MKFEYTYITNYENGEFVEVYEIEAESAELADFQMVNGLGNLITKHNGIGKAKDMQFVKVEGKK